MNRTGRIWQRLTYANVTATLALFIALGGASYAAINLPANSVGTAQLRTGAVTLSKLGFPLGIATKKARVVFRPLPSSGLVLYLLSRKVSTRVVLSKPATVVVLTTVAFDAQQRSAPDTVQLDSAAITVRRRATRFTDMGNAAAVAVEPPGSTTSYTGAARLSAGTHTIALMGNTGLSTRHATVTLTAIALP